MNQNCTKCDRPREPRHDRPGKFFTLCDEHYAEYQRQKNKESYERHKAKRVQIAAVYRQSHPEAIKARWEAYYALPENQERKRKYQKTYRRPWREHVKDACELCGFVPKDKEDKCQLDIHHRDEDKTNNDPSNLQTVCSNCHRIIEHQPPRQKRL
jgi:HNH endonuclease